MLECSGGTAGMGCRGGIRGVVLGCHYREGFRGVITGRDVGVALMVWCKGSVYM